MSAVMEIYSLIKDLMVEAEKVHNDKLYSDLIDIKKQVNELDEENQRLKEQLRIKGQITYDDNGQSFTLVDNPKIHYCAVCYGNNSKLIPMMNSNGVYTCRICEEIWRKQVLR